MKLQTIFLVIIIVLGFLLRFIDVSNNPPGLYSDEVSIGYNAYKVLTTGKDEYGVPHPLWFRSFGDYKLPVYVYSVAGAMSIFGKTEFAVRIPSILAGTLTIFIFYLFIKKLLELEKDKDIKKRFAYLPILGALLLATSSWHIQFSRGGFEITVGTLLFLLGCYFYAFFIQKKSIKLLLFGIFFFALAVYTYHIFRILSPLALIFIAIHQKIYKKPKSLPIVLLAIIFFLPIVLFSLSPEGIERFKGTSAFGELNITSPLQQLFIYPIDYIRNYLSFYSFDFLFSYGDGIGRHQMPDFGDLFRWQLPFLLGGIFVLVKMKRSTLKFATFLLFFSAPLAGAVAVPSPHALRSLPLVLPCIILIAVGIISFVQSIHKYRLRVASVVIIGLVALFEFFLYLHFYYIHYPIINQLDWGSNYKDLVLSTSAIKHKYNHIIVDQNLAFAPAYFHFYDDSINFTVVPVTWHEPASWKGSKTLYIRPFYGQDHPDGVIKNITLNGTTNPIFAQLWELK
ncbi:MAG TPA: glycosyltransferase family 39 protein [Candidatus Saccharimonadales bacterium]|nr:glycosyltransferase family 39 protein [Candidatus Saccharimonadales bacterium]